MDPFLTASPVYRQAIRTQSRSMPLAAYEVAEVGSDRWPGLLRVLVIVGAGLGFWAMLLGLAGLMWRVLLVSLPELPAVAPPSGANNRSVLTFIGANLLKFALYVAIVILEQQVNHWTGSTDTIWAGLFIPVIWPGAFGLRRRA